MNYSAHICPYTDDVPGIARYIDTKATRLLAPLSAAFSVVYQCVLFIGIHLPFKAPYANESESLTSVFTGKNTERDPQKTVRIIVCLINNVYDKTIS